MKTKIQSGRMIKDTENIVFIKIEKNFNKLLLIL